VTVILFLTYAVGVVIGLAVMRDSWALRVVTAVLWPLGPLAFVAVMAIMLLAAAVLWPLYVLGGLAVVAAVAWLLS
jgi:hypothetical protein